MTLEASVNRAGPPTAYIYDLLGQRIRGLEAVHIVGTDTVHVKWDGHTTSGSSAPSAVYLVRLTDARGATLLGIVVRVW